MKDGDRFLYGGYIRARTKALIWMSMSLGLPEILTVAGPPKFPK